MNNINELATERLILRPWRESDFTCFFEFFSDETTSKYVGGIQTEEEAWRLMASYIGHWQLKGFGYLAVDEKTTGEFVGCVGLWKSPPWPKIELGYWFIEKKQGQGFATGAAIKLKQFAFEELKVDTLVSYIDPGYIASKRVAKRIGGVKEKTIELLDYGPHEVYRYKYVVT